MRVPRSVVIPGDRVAIELYGEAGREVVRDQDRIRPLGDVHGIVIGEAEQDGQDANVHVHQVPDALPHHRDGRAREGLAPLQQHEVEGLLGAEVLADVRLGALAQLRVIEDGDLHLEDRRFLGTCVALSAIAHRAQSFLGALQRVVQPRDLAVHLLVGDDAMRHIGDLPPEQVDGAQDDARRRGDPDDGAIHGRSALAELAGDEARERFHRLAGIGAVGAQLHL